MSAVADWMRAAAPAMAGLVLGLVATGASAAIPCTLEPGPTRSVAHVIDGETLRLDDGIELRLLGALAPRARDAGVTDPSAAWPPATEARAALDALVGARSVSLAFTGERADRYSRVLAHLVVERDGEQIWVQGRMVETGRARAYALPGGDACLPALVALERKARNAGLGMWSHAAYQIRPADRPTELTRYRHTFQLVRGRIERGRSTRSLSIVELASGERPAAAEGRSQWNAFRVVWRRQLADRLLLASPESMVGRNILIRGWIDDHRGPEIELVSPGQIELED